jgi:Caspase domain
VEPSRLHKYAGRLVSLFATLVLLSPVAAQEQNRQLTQNGPPAGTSSKRIALVIGNGAYTSAPPLKNPPNDARDIAATLKTLGFDVTSGVNVGQRDMKRLIREFGLKLKAGGSGLFYYAGHGVQSKGRNYLIPVDANIQSEAEVEDSGVDASLMLNFMDDAQNGLNIVILDACRNNPFARSFRTATDGLAQVDAPTGTLIAYATSPGRVASDGTGQNGLYTSELLKQMMVPGLSITDMFMRVRAQVIKQTGSKQVPWEASSLVGSFYFSGAPTDIQPAPTTTRIDPAAYELSYWDTIKNSNDPNDFKGYLEKYPNGQFADLARRRASISSQPSTTSQGNSPATQEKNAGPLIRYDGVYRVIKDAKTTYWLRFYEDGTVIDVVTSGGMPEQIARWFDRSNQNVGQGIYQVHDSKIAFSTRDKYATLTYSGIIGITSLQLRRSWSNGSSGTFAFEFIKIGLN